ncbi:MAG: GNAT family N-acetyltransferase [Tindallia sp. MSAO_Bac2]|nr:MAG: GNAT family N-acetyltransferase [Tindallia sp. MSAO_Bac2]
MIPGSAGKEKIIFRSYIKVRRVKAEDIDSVFQIAASVGTGEKDSSQGFLVDNYASDPAYYKEKFLQLSQRLEHFYVAENVTGKSRKQIVGFLIAYTKQQWLEDNPTWLEDVHWHPSFDQDRLNDFVVVDKTAIQSYLTGHGIGSELYKRLIADIRAKDIETILAETIISPTPNFASLAFRKKQHYLLAGVRYEDYIGETFTDLIYYKDISQF